MSENPDGWRREPTLQRLLDHLEAEWRALPDKPRETPEGTLACLWHLAAGRSLALSQARGMDLPELDEEQHEALEEFIAKRLKGIPLAHLTERQDFVDLVLLASPKAMVPREETELLVHTALRKLEESPVPQPLVIDLCTGSGNVALALATQVPRARVYGGDLSEESVAFARQNAEFVGRPDVCFEVSNVARAFKGPSFEGRVDLVTCNPPYISSSRVDELTEEIRDHEPRLAFDGGPFGVSILFRVLKESPTLLKGGGWLVMEIGLGQGDPMERRLKAHRAFDVIDTERDRAGHIRVIAARKA